MGVVREPYESLPTYKLPLQKALLPFNVADVK